MYICICIYSSMTPRIFSPWTLVKVQEKRQADNSVHLVTVCVEN